MRDRPEPVPLMRHPVPHVLRAGVRKAVVTQIGSGAWVVGTEALLAVRDRVPVCDAGTHRHVVIAIRVVVVSVVIVRRAKAECEARATESASEAPVAKAASVTVHCGPVATADDTVTG